VAGVGEDGFEPFGLFGDVVIAVEDDHGVAAPGEVVGAFGIDGGGAVFGEAEGGEVVGRGVVGLVFVIAEGGDQRDGTGGVTEDGEEVIPFIGIIATADEIAGEDDEI